MEIQSHLKRINEEYLNKLEIKIVIEDKSLGTGGSILNAIKTKFKRGIFIDKWRHMD